VTDESNDPTLKSWVESAQGSDFPIQNLPLGVFSVGERRRRPGVAIGDYVLDLTSIADLLDEDWREDLAQPVLNAWLARGPRAQRTLRSRLQELLSDERFRNDVEEALIGQTEARMHVPCLIGDYTDFYVGIHHATNVGKQFRPDNPLLPNYKYVPIGYHGRASSVRASGEPVIRPNGQRKAPDSDAPEYGPSRRLDYELELGIWIGEGNELGQPIPIGEAGDHIAGYCLLNDWSARWPRYADTAQQLRLAAVASIPMGHDAHRLGVLDLYDSQPHAWSDEDLRISAAFADLTAGFLIQASQLSDQQRLNEHLERALQTRILIEQAKGIIANHHNISPEHAFDVIRKYARSRRVTLAEVSRHIIYQGVRPAVPAPSGQPARPRSTR